MPVNLSHGQGRSRFRIGGDKDRRNLHERIARHVDFEEKDAVIQECLNPFEFFERSGFSPMELFDSLFGCGRSGREDGEETL